MKNLRKTAFLLLATGITNVGVVLASELDSAEAQIDIRQIDTTNKKALISITKLPEDQSSVLIIRDEEGNVLYRETIRQHEEYAKRYDFSQLSANKYIVELKTAYGMITESLTLKEGKTQMQYFKPAIQIQPGLIKMAFTNRITTPVSLKLYNESGEVLYEETVATNQRFAKGLDVSRLKRGQYSLTVLGDHYVYAKSIQVK